MFHKLLPVVLRVLAKPFLSPGFSPAFQRRWTSALFLGNPCARDTGFEAQTLNGVPVRRIATASASDKVILYLHGGAYILGNPQGHRGLCSYLASLSNATVYSVDYRLAPEHPYPAALDDALVVYRALLEKGVEANNLMLAGDSAGGGLALATALNIRQQGLPMPDRLFLISPFVDMTLSGDSMQTVGARDPLLRQDWLEDCGQKYRDKLPADHPDCSPLFAQLAGLPPTLIHVGSEEILLDDARRLHATLAAQGGVSQLEVFDGYWHDFQLQPGLLLRARESLQKAGDFLNQA